MRPSIPRPITTIAARRLRVGRSCGPCRNRSIQPKERISSAVPNTAGITVEKETVESNA